MVYQNALFIELKNGGLRSEKEKKIQVYYDTQLVGDYMADIIVEDKVILELKSVENLVKAHEVQLINYLNGMKKEIGLLINFGPNGVEVKRKYRKPMDRQDQPQYDLPDLRGRQGSHDCFRA